MKIQTPHIIRFLYPSLLWKVNTASKDIFLTFDDGPHPEITPKVLNILNQFNAKASFFCVGENIFKFPYVFDEIVKQNHTVGNHTYNHLNGWKTANTKYFDNIEKCNNLVKSGFFRPPYGKITPSQVSKLKKRYKIVMWSALSYDFSNKISKNQCFDIAVKNTDKGTIMVFHDSEKAARNMLYALPRYLEHFSALGYRFRAIG